MARAPAVADEEDVVISALNSFFAGVEGERYPELNSREDLWRLLSTITKRKTTNLVKLERRVKRRGGCPQSADGEPAVDPGPSPELHVLFEEECQRLLYALE